MKPLVVIVGRPNVGKSTLFNRITRSRDALVDDFPGVTRDRIVKDAKWNDRAFMVVDTGGFVDDAEDPFAPKIRDQVLTAMDEAHVVILLLDGKEGILPFDAEMAKMMRTLTKPVLCAVNKIDGPENEPHLYEFYQLGFNRVFPISAEHRYGMNDFLDALIGTFPESVSDTLDNNDNPIIRIAVVGRPNVGKSSLINCILGQSRLLVSDVPGTTRDAVDTDFIVHDTRYRLIDTAGIRRKGKVSGKIEKISILKALKSLDRCHIALILIDADEGVTDQDVTIAGYAHDRGRGCIFLLNKWDLIEKDHQTAKKYKEEVRFAAKYLSFAPVMTISAKTGQRVPRIFNLVNTVFNQFSGRIDTGPLNRILEAAVYQNEPSLYRGRRIKFFYATQTRSRPPKFLVFVNHPEAVHFSYKRYLINQIRKGTGLDKTPIRLLFRRRERRELRGVRRS